MKSVMFSIGIAFSFVAASAQTTNTFPLNGSAGIGTLSPSSYYHGGNNKVLEVYNPNTTLNSQAHIVLTTGSTINNSGAGTVSWVSKNSTGFQGMAYIGSSLEGDATGNAAARLIFATSNGTSAPTAKMTISKDGNVSIGTDNPQGYRLAVAGSMIAESVKVKLQGAWPDFVFAKDYALPPIAETEEHIRENGHLPGIPSAAEVAKNGIELGEMNKKLLQKIEELTLYLIEQNKRIQKLTEKVETLEKDKN
jgi:NOL1/NOP2/fmu family ribosome biogenesis protein